MPGEEFEQHRAAVISARQQKDCSVADEAERFWEQISSRRWGLAAMQAALGAAWKLPPPAADAEGQDEIVRTLCHVCIQCWPEGAAPWSAGVQVASRCCCRYVMHQRQQEVQALQEVQQQQLADWYARHPLPIAEAVRALLSVLCMSPPDWAPQFAQVSRCCAASQV